MLLPLEFDEWLLTGLTADAVGAAGFVTNLLHTDIIYVCMHVLYVFV